MCNYYDDEGPSNSRNEENFSLPELHFLLKISAFVNGILVLVTNMSLMLLKAIIYTPSKEEDQNQIKKENTVV